MSADECKKIPQIVQGERKELTVTLLNANTGEAIDVSTATEIQSIHPKQKDYLIKKLEQTAIAQITDITCLADVNSSLASRYFLIYSTTGVFAFWFSVDAAGSPPVVSGATIVEVAISENDVANDVAEALRVAIDNQAAFSATRLNEVVTVTNAVAGEVEEIKDFSTNFTFSITTEGENEVVDSIEVVGTGQIKIKLQQSETPLLKVENRATFYIAVDFTLPTGRKIYKIKDGYDVCGVDFSLD
jgi:hypothetical protein